MIIRAERGNAKRTLLSIKRSMDGFLIDCSWRLGAGSTVPRYLLAGLSKEKREVIKANWLVLKGEERKGADILSDVIVKNPYDRNAIISLGSIYSQVGLQECSFAWEKIRKIFFLIDKPEKINDLSFPLFSLGVDLALRCEPELAEKAIKNIYFPFIWKCERYSKEEFEPVFYWHIPKTGGTSFNTHISKVWYRSGANFLPSYTVKKFFSTTLKLQDGVLPYLSSAHLSLSDFDTKDISRYRKILVLRDPVSRSLSAWRQYCESPKSRLLILPQHGFVWNFLPSRNLVEWAANAPTDVLNVMNWTFSGDVSNANKFVDDVVDIEDLDFFGSEFLSQLGIHLEPNKFSVMKNRTKKDSKKLQPDVSQKNFLKKKLDLDYKFFEYLK